MEIRNNMENSINLLFPTSDPFSRKMTPDEFKKHLLSDPLPKNPIAVTGDLNLIEYKTLTRLPDNLTVERSLIIEDCFNLTRLPDNLTVKENLEINNCPNLTRLTGNLTVERNLIIEDCLDLTRLPDNLTVKENLEISNCPNLTRLPDNLTVKDDLIIQNCLNLTRLPDNLTVEGNLEISNCFNLTRLTDNLTVEGNLIIENCPALTSLPGWIETFGSRNDGEEHQIILCNTGLSDAILERLRQVSLSGVIFNIINMKKAFKGFKSMDEAINFWKKHASGSFTEEIPKTSFKTDKEKNNLLIFLSRLGNTADYKNVKSRVDLASRILKTLIWMAKDDYTRSFSMERIEEGLTSCDDRITLTLDDLEIQRRLYNIENSADDESIIEKSYLKLGREVFYLKGVHEYARKHMETLKWIDEVEVVLAFQMGLAQKLDLPVSTKNMIFLDCAQVQPADIDKAEREIKEKYSEAKFESEFLTEWTPYLKFKRKQECSQPYESLARKTTGQMQTCAITMVETDQPVLCAGNVYDFEALRRIYINSGQDPFTKKDIVWKNVESVGRVEPKLGG